MAWLTKCMAEAYRVLKPGGHALRLVDPAYLALDRWAIEDAGFDIRDCVLHLFGSGFPKSLDVSKAIDKAAGAEREVTGPPPYTRGRAGQSYSETRRVSYDYQPQPVTAPATEDAARWSGFGTALKPGQEMWWLARKPLAAGTVAANVLQFGTGALNIDGCRVPGAEDGSRNRPPSHLGSTTTYAQDEWTRTTIVERRDTTGFGRWPTNIVLTHSAACEPIGLRKSSPASAGRGPRPPNSGNTYGALVMCPLAVAATGRERRGSVGVRPGLPGRRARPAERRPHLWRQSRAPTFRQVP